MGFVSEGKGLGSTFFFELPVYSAAFAGKERQEISPVVSSELDSPSNGARTIKPFPKTVRRVVASSVHVQEGGAVDEVEEYSPSSFDSFIAQVPSPDSIGWLQAGPVSPTDSSRRDSSFHDGAIEPINLFHRTTGLQPTASLSLPLKIILFFSYFF